MLKRHITSTLTLDFSVPRAGSNECLLFESPSLWHFCYSGLNGPRCQVILCLGKPPGDYESDFVVIVTEHPNADLLCLVFCTGTPTLPRSPAEHAVNSSPSGDVLLADGTCSPLPSKWLSLSGDTMSSLQKSMCLSERLNCAHSFGFQNFPVLWQALKYLDK